MLQVAGMTQLTSAALVLCRSPWNAADKYDPETLELVTPVLPLEAALQTSASALEYKFNDAFDTYRLMYFDGGISSVYLHVDAHDDEGDASSFTVTVLIKKVLDQEAEWDSIHVVECSESDGSTSWTYRSTSSIILHLASSALKESSFSVGGSLVEQVPRIFLLLPLLYGRTKRGFLR